MEEVEFYTSPEGQVYYKKDGHNPKRLTKFSEVVEPLITIIRNRFPECYARLVTLYKEHATQVSVSAMLVDTRQKKYRSSFYS